MLVVTSIVLGPSGSLLLTMWRLAVLPHLSLRTTKSPQVTVVRNGEEDSNIWEMKSENLGTRKYIPQARSKGRTMAEKDRRVYSFCL